MEYLALILAFFAGSGVAALAVFVYMSKQTSSKHLSEVVAVLNAHNERLSYLFHKDEEIDKHIASVAESFLILA